MLENIYTANAATPPSPPAPIGARIRQLRTELDLTLAELAVRVGTSAPTMHRYETGWDRFTLDTLRRIATALEARLEIRLIRPEPPGRVKPTPAGLIARLRPLFWDKTLVPDDLTRYPGWVLERVLAFGTREQVAEARGYFDDEELLAALERPGVDARTRSYWKLVLEA